MVIVAKLLAVEGREKEVEQALLEMIPKVKEESGTLVYTLHRDQNNPRVFLFYEKYKDVDALVAHSATPHFKTLFKTLKPLLEGQPEISTYIELAGIDS